MRNPNIAARLMIVSDLDNTMVDHQDTKNESLLRFGALWVAEYSVDSLLVFSTGRSPALYKELRTHKPLLTPDITILSVGTEIMYGDSMIPDDGWEKELNIGWNRTIIVEEASKFSELTFQVETEQRPHKVSFIIDKVRAPRVIEELSNKLKARGLDVKIIYSGGADLDILPQAAGKGQALAYLLGKFTSEGKSPENVLVCGDSGNDAELFTVADVYGVIVSNALEELVQWHDLHAKENHKILRATERCAAAIIQALQHFSIAPNVSPRDVFDLKHGLRPGKDEVAVIRDIVMHQLLWEKWLLGDVENNEETFQQLKASMGTHSTVITPWGVEENILDAIEMLRPLHGIKRGKRFYIWVDRVHPIKSAGDVWIVKFDKWQQNEEELSCRLSTVALDYQASARGVVLHMHETWRDGYNATKLMY